MADRPRVNGVLETCLYVADVPASRAFYQRIFGRNAASCPAAPGDDSSPR